MCASFLLSNNIKPVVNLQAPNRRNADADDDQNNEVCAKTKNYKKKQERKTTKLVYICTYKQTSLHCLFLFSLCSCCLSPFGEK